MTSNDDKYVVEFLDKLLQSVTVICYVNTVGFDYLARFERSTFYH